jgi:hypothetical protein
VTDTDSCPSDGLRLRRILAGLSPRELEALYRFYELGQDSSQILQSLGLDANEFRELKWRVRRGFLSRKRSQ